LALKFTCRKEEEVNQYSLLSWESTAVSDEPRTDASAKTRKHTEKHSQEHSQN
jgi:hypothetical protein